MTQRSDKLDMSFAALKWFVITLYTCEWLGCCVGNYGVVRHDCCQPEWFLAQSRLVTWKSVLLGAHPVGVLDCATEVEHGKHGDDHHHTLEQKGQLKLLPYPERTWSKHQSHFLYRRELVEKEIQNRQQINICGFITGRVIKAISSTDRAFKVMHVLTRFHKESITFLSLSCPGHRKWLVLPDV